MPRALIINPNTSKSVTQQLTAHMTPLLGRDWQIDAVTARFGSAYIASEASYAIAAHAVLDAFAHTRQAYDVVVVGCFGDPGIEALRELADMPVVGLAEASFIAAARHGRFAIVTGGERWPAILQRRIDAAGLRAQLAGIHAVSPSGADLAAQREAAIDQLAAACLDTMQRTQADAIVLGGAALAGIGDELAQRLGMPILDSVSCAAQAVRDAINTVAPAAAPDRIPTIGLSASLSAMQAGQARETIY